jgi:predicted ATPase/DNA-binding SARP family transcriptional activator
MLKLILLGKLQAFLGDVPVTGFVSAKAQALLAYLAITRRPHTRDALSALYWGEMSDVDAKTNLRQALANLKKLVEPHVIIDRDSVAFNLDAPHWSDVGELDGLTFGAQPLRPDMLHRLDRAAALYRGDLLEGLMIRDAPEFEEWLVVQRERYRGLALQALIALSDHYTAQGRVGLADAIGYTSRALMLDPWREEEHRRLMVLLARSNQRTAALAQYEKCREALQKEFGIEPSLETRKVFERIRLAGETPRAELPTRSTQFIGREVEISAVLQALTHGRLVTLVGPGGIGKTRLALEVATQAGGDFINGVCFVGLTSVTSPEFICNAINDALRLPTSNTAPPKTQLQNYLREKEMLLVLDNIEHLLAGAPVLSDILSAAPMVKLLVTSRERMNLRGEKVVMLDGLAHPDENVLTVDDLASFAGPQLFVERAREVSANTVFMPTGDDVLHIARVCQLVQGMPLGIELAAAWTRNISCGEIVREIEHGLDFLESTMRDVPERQRSLRAVFEHSWRMLSPQEQKVFARLSVFRGGCTRQAAETVAGATPAVLASLIDKSMLKRAESGRYELHEVMRQYGAAQLAATPDSHEAVVLAHSHYYLHWLAQHHEWLYGNQQMATLQMLNADIDNIRAAWAAAVHHLDVSALSATLDGLDEFLAVQTQFQEATTVFAQTRDALQFTPSTLLGRVIAKLAFHTTMLGQHVEGGALALQAMELLRERDPDQSDANHSNERYCAQPLSTMGLAEAYSGHIERAEQCLLESLAIRRKFDDPMITGSLMNLGHLAWMRGQFAQSMAWVQEGLDMSRARGDRWNVARFSTALGVLANELGNLDAARLYLNDSLQVYRELHDREGIANALNGLGGTEVLLLHYDDALRLFDEAIAIYRDIGVTIYLAQTLVNAATVLNYMHGYKQSRLRAEEALHIARTIDAKNAVVMCLVELARSDFGEGHLAEARSHLIQAIRVGNASENVMGIMNALASLAEVIASEDSGDSTDSKLRSLMLLRMVQTHAATNAETRRIVERIQRDLNPTPDMLTKADALATQSTIEEVLRGLTGLGEAEPPTSLGEVV